VASGRELLESVRLRAAASGVRGSSARGGRTDCLVLLSGGIDSAGCLSFYRRLNCPVAGIFVDYGQPASLREQVSARALAHHYKIRLREISCSGFKVPPDEIPGRNAFLLFTALMAARSRPAIIALGIHAGTSYFDCSQAFATAADRLLREYTNGTTSLGTPFLRWTKPTVVAFCRERRVPLQLTWSCERGSVRSCGRCRSCQDRRALVC
jgi:7-cyano-7-deazaguanine synthase